MPPSHLPPPPPPPQLCTDFTLKVLNGSLLATSLPTTTYCFILQFPHNEPGRHLDRHTHISYNLDRDENLRLLICNTVSNTKSSYYDNLLFLSLFLSTLQALSSADPDQMIQGLHSFPAKLTAQQSVYLQWVGACSCGTDRK